MSVSSAVTRRNEEIKQKSGDLARFLNDLTPQVARALPKGLDADRIARLALTAARKNPDLLDCSAESFAGALLTAAALGLEPDVNGEAYLVPYRGECSFIPGYQGIAKLFYQHPLGRELTSGVVYERDDFEYAKGTDPYLRHKPAVGDRGKIVAYYAVAILATGAKPFEVLTPDEVKALRGGKVGPSGKIADPQHWMERKTVLRQLLKLLPKSTRLQQAIEAEDKAGTDLYRDRLAERQSVQAIETATTTPAPPAGAAQAAGPGGPVYADPASGEVVDAEVMDPPDYDATAEPAGWGN